MNYVYWQSEPGLFTTGYHNGTDWVTDNDYNSREEAAARVHWLNGGGDDSDLIKELYLTYSDLVKPGQFDLNLCEACIKLIDKWLRNPDNDCLRARGDQRWQDMTDLNTKFNQLTTF